MERKLERDDIHKSIAGVCAGLANYLNVDVAIVRAVFVCVALLGGASILAYIVLWIVMPRRNYFFDPTVDYTVPPASNPFTGSKFNDPRFTEPQYTQEPFANMPKKPTTTGIIIGAILIVVGLIILIDNFDLIPDIDFGQLWPVALVLAGVAVIFSGKNNKPWNQTNWHKQARTENEPIDDTTTEQL